MGTFLVEYLPNRGNVLAHVGHAACPTWARCLPKNVLFDSQKSCGYYPKGIKLLSQRNSVTIPKKHSCYPKGTWLLPPNNHSLPKEISSLPKKIKPALDFHRDILGSAEIGGECSCFRRIICRFRGVCDTSMILYCKLLRKVSFA